MKYKNYINSYTKDNRIFSKEDISNMTVRDAYGNKRAIIAQNRKIGVPSDAELRNSSNVIWINPYRRDDGTPVKGHWRSKSGTGGIAGDESPVIMDETVKSDSDALNPDNQTPQDEESGDEDISPVSAIIDVIVAIMQLIFKDSEIGEIVQAIAPILKVFGEKIFSDDDSEETETDSEDSEETSETESEPTEEPEPESEPELELEPDDKLTGGASEIEKDTEYTDYTVGEPIVDVSTPEKVQELMYPKEIAGVERGEPKTFFEMINLGVNPKYMGDEDIDGEYSKNCQSCTVAAELVIRGYDVEAVGASNPVAQRLKSSNETAYISPSTGKKCAYDIIFTNEISCYDYLEKNVKMGERYELSYNSPTESGDAEYDKEHEKDGHVVLITRDEQYGLMYYDPQDNRILSGEQVKDYISTWFQYKEPVRAPRILRIDDKLLNPNYVNHVVRRRNGF